MNVPAKPKERRGTRVTLCLCCSGHLRAEEMSMRKRENENETEYEKTKVWTEQKCSIAQWVRGDAKKRAELPSRHTVILHQ